MCESSPFYTAFCREARKRDDVIVSTEWKSVLEAEGEVDTDKYLKQKVSGSSDWEIYRKVQEIKNEAKTKTTPSKLIYKLLTANISDGKVCRKLCTGIWGFLTLTRLNLKNNYTSAYKKYVKEKNSDKTGLLKFSDAEMTSDEQRDAFLALSFLTLDKFPRQQGTYDGLSSVSNRFRPTRDWLKKEVRDLSLKKRKGSRQAGTEGDEVGPTEGGAEAAGDILQAGSGAGPTHSPKRFHQDAGLAVPAGSGSNTLQARISTDSSEIPPPPLPESSTQREDIDVGQMLDEIVKAGVDACCIFLDPTWVAVEVRRPTHDETWIRLVKKGGWIDGSARVVAIFSTEERRSLCAYAEQDDEDDGEGGIWIHVELPDLGNGPSSMPLELEIYLGKFRFSAAIDAEEMWKQLIQLRITCLVSSACEQDQIREPLQEMMTLYQQGPNEARAVARGLLHVMAHCKPQRFSAGVTAAGFMRLLLRDLLSDERPVGEILCILVGLAPMVSLAASELRFMAGDLQCTIPAISPESAAQLLSRLSLQDTEQLVYATEAVRIVANSKNRSLLDARETIAQLNRLLQAGSDAVQEHAAGALANLVISAQHAEEMVAACTAVPLLVRLHFGSGLVQEQAAWALCSLTAVEPRCHAALIHSGTVTVLQELLEAGDLPQKVQSATAGILRALASSEPGPVGVDSIAPLVRVLETDWFEVQERAVTALLEMCKHPDNHAALQAAGLITSLSQVLEASLSVSGSPSDFSAFYAAEALWRLLASPDGPVVEAAAEALLTFLRPGTAQSSSGLSAPDLSESWQRGASIIAKATMPVQQLMETLSSGRAQLAAAAALRVLVQDEYISGWAGDLRTLTPVFIMERTALRQAWEALISVVTNLLQSSMTGAQENAAAAASVLASHPEFCHRMVAAGALEPLAKLLERGSAEAAALAAETFLFVSAHKAHQHSIMESATLQALSAALDSESSSAKQHAIGALCNLAAVKQYRPAMVAARVVPAAVQLVQASRGETQFRAAALLHNLAGTPEGQQAVVEAGGITQIAALIGLSDMKVVEEAVKALGRLAKLSHCNQAAILRAGAVEPLVRLLDSSSPPVQRWAVNALALLTHSNEAAAAEALEAGAIPILVRLLSGEAADAQLQIECAMALWNLASISEGPEAVAENGGLTPLVQQLGSPHMPMQLVASGALAQLAVSAPVSQQIAAAGAASSLLPLLLKPTGAGAMAALLRLSLRPENHDSMLSAGADLSSLGIVLARGTPELQTAAANLLANLARHSKCRAFIRTSGMLQQLIQLLLAPSEELQRVAAMALTNLAAFVEDREALLQAGAVMHLVHLVRMRIPAVQQEAAVALHNLAYLGAAAANEIIACDGIQPLLELMQIGAGSTDYAAYIAAEVLLKVAEAGSVQQTALLSAGAAPALVQVLREGSKRQRDVAAMLLCCLAAAKEGWLPASVGAILGMLSSDEDLLQSCAAVVLGNLAWSADVVPREAAAEGISSTLRMLRERRSAMTVNAAAVAASGLTYVPGNHRALHHAGLSACLVDLLESGPDRAKCSAALAIAKLASSPHRDVAEAVAAAAAAQLTPLLEHGAPQVQVEAALSLLCIAERCRPETVLIFAAQAIPSLIRMLDLQDAPPQTAQDARQRAAGALWCLALDDSRYRQLISPEGSPALVRLLRQGCAEVHLPAVGALRSLADKEHLESIQAIAAAGGVAALVESLKAEAANVRQLAAGAVWNLAAADEALHAAIVADGAVQPLIAMLDEQSSSVVAQIEAAGALASLAYSWPSAAAVSAATEPLVKLLRSENEDVILECTRALLNLSFHSANHAGISKAGAEEWLQIIAARRGEIGRLAAQALENLTKAKEYRVQQSAPEIPMPSATISSVLRESPQTSEKQKYSMLGLLPPGMPRWTPQLSHLSMRPLLATLTRDLQGLALRI